MLIGRCRPRKQGWGCFWFAGMRTRLESQIRSAARAVGRVTRLIRPRTPIGRLDPVGRSRRKGTVSVSWFRKGAPLRIWIVLVLVAFPVGSAHSEPEAESFYDYTGVYLQAGVVAGFFVAQESGVDFDPGGGFAVSAGYRVNSYFAGELDFAYVFDSKTDDFTKLDGVDFGESDDSKTLDYYEFVINLKGYPLGYFEVAGVPDWIQPYGKFGLGFAEADVGYLDEVRFLVRFGAGVDFMFTDQLGIYFDGGYSIITQTVRESDKTILDGQGQLGLGGLIRF